MTKMLLLYQFQFQAMTFVKSKHIRIFLGICYNFTHVLQ